MFRKLVAGLTVVASCTVLIGFGFMLDRSSRDEIVEGHKRIESELKQRLAATQDAHVQVVAELKVHIEQAHERTAGISTDLDRSNKSHSETQGQLGQARKTISQLRRQLNKAEKERESLQATLDSRRPLLSVEVLKNSDLTETALEVANEGNATLRIVHTTGQSWKKGIEDALFPYWGKTLMPPGNRVRVFTFSFPSEVAFLVKSGKVQLQYVVCLIYESALENGKRRWMADYWFQYDVKSDDFWFSTNNVRPTSERDCDIKALMPIDWLE